MSNGVRIIGEGTYDPDQSWHEVGAVGEPAFENSWVSYDGGSTYATPAFRMDPEGWVKLKGLAKSGTLGVAIFTLPVGYRPLKDVYVKALANNIQTFLRVASTGTVTVYNQHGSGTNAYVNLDNAYFPAWQSYDEFNDHFRIITDSNWQVRNLDTEFPTSLWRRASGMWQLFGLHGVTTGSVVGKSLYPDMPYLGHLFGMCDSTATPKLVLISNSRGLVTDTTTTAHSIIDGEFTRFDREGVWLAPTFTNSWVNYGYNTDTRYANAGYWKDENGFVHLRGLVKNGSSASATMFTLPAGYRPLDRHIFSTISLAGACRIDVTAAGDVSAAAGGSTTWTSLSGVCFFAEQ